jgi:hypothetical protein
MYIQLEGVDSAGAAWRLYLIRMDWNGMMIRVVWWEEERGLWAEGEDCGRKDCNLCQAPTAMCMVTASRSSMLHNDAGQDWVQLFPFLFRSLIVW